MNLYIRLIKVNGPTTGLLLAYICLMMFNNQLYRLRILTGISLALLLLFLSFWNRENYKRNKAELEQEINNQMTLACSQYRDSVVQTIFKYIAKDTIKKKMRFPSLAGGEDSIVTMESLVIQEMIEGPEFPGGSEAESATLSISIDTEELPKSSSKIIVWQSGESSRLRFENTSDTVIKSLDPLSLMDSFPVGLRRMTNSMPTAYARIDSIFRDKLRKQEIDVPHRVTKDSVEIANANGTITVPFDYQSFGFEATPVALFESYQPYIWKTMSPALFMSLILFSVVAISFFILLNTWIKQQQLSSIKNEFVSNMTHELKTPIATIGVAIEALENYGGLDDPVKRKEYLNISKHEVNRLKILVDKVLKMSTIEQSDSVLHLEEINLKQVTEGILSSMQLHFEKHKVQLDYQFEEGSYHIKGDQIHLTNVLYNLIDNAIKYSGEQPQLAIKLQSDLNHVVIKVSDQGVGIDKAYQDKVFDRFFREPTEDIHNVKGFGLGLHYVHTIVTKHGGSIELESDKGKGSQFTIKLPRL